MKVTRVDPLLYQCNADHIRVQKHSGDSLTIPHIPEDELAEPVLALSKDEAEADEVAEDTPDEEPMPEKTCEKFSSPWSGASQRASAPLRESMEGVGDVISPDFCLTIASRTTPVNTDLKQGNQVNSTYKLLFKY